jgi:hypothetical protein
LAVAVVAGFASILLSRAIDRRRDTSLIEVLSQVRDQLLVDRPQRTQVVLPAPRQVALPSSPNKPRVSTPVVQVKPPLAGAVSSIRVIAPDQRDRMVKILALAPEDIIITSDGDHEADAFADQVAGVFRDAGWKVERSLFVGVNRALPPLAADLLETPRDVAVRAAFAAAGYALPAFDPTAPSNSREILIGSARPQASAPTGSRSG